MPGLEHWTRQPYTKNDGRWSILMVFCGAAAMTSAAALYSPVNTVRHVWPSFTVGNVGYVIGIIWTFLHYNYLLNTHRHMLDKMPSTTILVIFTSSDFGGAMGISKLAFKNDGIYPVAVGMWATFVTVAVFHYFAARRLARFEERDEPVTG